MWSIKNARRMIRGDTIRGRFIHDYYFEKTLNWEANDFKIANEARFNRHFRKNKIDLIIFNRSWAVADVSSDLDWEVSSDWSWEWSLGVGFAKHHTSHFNNVESLPDHSADWSAVHVFHQTGEEGLNIKNWKFSILKRSVFFHSACREFTLDLRSA